MYTTEGKQPEAPGKRNGAEWHQGGKADPRGSRRITRHPPGQSRKAELTRGARGRKPKDWTVARDRNARGRTRSSSTCPGGERDASKGGRMQKGIGTIRRVRELCRRRQSRRQAGNCRLSEHTGRAGQNAAKAACGEHVGEGDGGKGRDTMTCAAEQCSTRHS